MFAQFRTIALAVCVLMCITAAVAGAAATHSAFTAHTTETFDATQGTFTADGKLVFDPRRRFPLPFDAHAAGRVVSPGTPSPTATTTGVSGRVSKGSFVTRPAEKGVHWFGQGPGSFVARDTNQQDLSGNGTDDGLVLVHFRRVGFLCARFSESFSSTGASGTFRTLGGKGAVAIVTVGGSFKSVPSAGSFTTDTQGVARDLAKPKHLPASCRALRRL